MLFPEIENFKGKVIEIHGSPDSGKTKAILRYIKHIQDSFNSTTFYLDADNALQNMGEFSKLDHSRIWLTFSMNENVIYQIPSIMKNVDLFVLDNFTIYPKKPWRFLSELHNMAKKYKTAVILVNQCRCVLNHKTGKFEDKPYRYNIIQKYCDAAIDWDNQTIDVFRKEENIVLDNTLLDLLSLV